MKSFHDKSGKRFGALVALEVERWHLDNRYYSRPAVWECKCDCGRAVAVATWDLTFDVKTSCGECDTEGRRHVTAS